MGMSDGRIERVIGEVETDENGNVPDYDDIVSRINCEMYNNHDWCNSEPITFKAKYIANVTKELDGKFFNGTEIRIKHIYCFVKKYATTREVFNTISELAFSYQANNERLIGVEIVNE